MKKTRKRSSKLKFKVTKARKQKFRFKKYHLQTGKIYTKVFYNKYCSIVLVKSQVELRLINVLKLSKRELKKFLAKRLILNKKQCELLKTFPKRYYQVKFPATYEKWKGNLDFFF